jgi:hypothetical protein
MLLLPHSIHHEETLDLRLEALVLMIENFVLFGEPDNTYKILEGHHNIILTSLGCFQDMVGEEDIL